MTIIVNMTKALDIKKDMVRRERAPLLAALDVEMMKAIESGNDAKKTEIAEKKQALRDATNDPVLTQATTPEELKAATPQALAS